MSARICAQNISLMLQSLRDTKAARSYPRLEVVNLLVGESVGLGDHRNQVDLGVKPAHDLDVEGLERVAGRLDEEDAGVDAVVDDVHAVNLVLSVEVGIKALLNVLNNRSPRLVVVDKVTEAGGVDNGQTQANTSLLDVGAEGLDLDGLGNDVEGGLLLLLRGVKRSVEERVHKRRLSEAGFTYTGLDSKWTYGPASRLRMLETECTLTNNHDVEVEPFPDALTVPLVRQVGETDVARQLPADDIGGLRDRGDEVGGRIFDHRGRVRGGGGSVRV